MLHVGEEIRTDIVERVAAWSSYLGIHFSRDCTEIMPTFTGVTLFFRDGIDESVINRISVVCAQYKETVLEQSGTVRHEIELAYKGEDLAYVAAYCGRSISDVISLHARPMYTVGMLGFTPGFPYLIGLPEELHVPRRAVPRTAVRAGAVAIGGQQTGIYPHASPGGWQILAYTKVALFDVHKDPPVRLSPGDKVKFVPV